MNRSVADCDVLSSTNENGINTEHSRSGILNLVSCSRINALTRSYNTP